MPREASPRKSSGRRRTRCCSAEIGASSEPPPGAARSRAEDDGAWAFAASAGRSSLEDRSNTIAAPIVRPSANPAATAALPIVFIQPPVDQGRWPPRRERGGHPNPFGQCGSASEPECGHETYGNDELNGTSFASTPSPIVSAIGSLLRNSHPT